ncbi:histamine H2 receptor-like [Oculina patagonica]
MVSLPECIARLAVGLTESVAIVTLNIITIIAFIKNRNLRKRSTYLVINLAVADILVGGLAAYVLFYNGGAYCKLWKYIFTKNWESFATIIVRLFPAASLTNITAISLERLHATFWPFRHRVIKIWIYRLTVAVVWFIAGFLSIALAILGKKSVNDAFHLLNSFNFFCLFFICVSYASIVIKLRCGAQPQHHGAASRERKLTMTLFIVTFVSLLLWLPFVITAFLYYTTDIFSSLSEITFSRFDFTLIVLFFANSLVNPILYTIRLPEFRRALVALFRKRPRRRRLNQAAGIPLRDM